MIRRTIEELAAKYQRARISLRDVYVEGPNDKQILDMLVRSSGELFVPVYSIDTIEISDAKLVELGLPTGSARSRVIALAKSLESHVAGRHPTTFLIDRDQQDFLPELAVPNLELSELGTLELSFLGAETFERLVAIARVDPDATLELMQEAYRAAGKIFFMRAAAKRLGLPLKMVDPSDFVRKDLSFDHTGYLERCVNSCGLRRRMDEISEAAQSCENECSASGLPSERFANDHDLYKLVLRMVRHRGSGITKSAAEIRDLMMMAADLRRAQADPVIKKILSD